MMMNVLTGLLAAFTSSIALVILIHSLLVDVREASAGWIAVKVVFSAVTVLQGALTLHYLLSRGPGGAGRTRIILAGGAGLVLLGAATVIHTVHLARVTGDWEMYIIAAGLAMMAQGLLTTWNLWKRAPGAA